MPSPLSPEALADFKRRHLAFLEARLVSPKAAEEWRAHAAGVYQALLAARVGDVIDAGAIADALDAALTGEAVERAARPVARRLLPLLLREIRADEARLTDRVPAATRKKIDALLERPGLLPERFLREVVEQEAVDEVMRDVLYEGLKEFSEKVNPFTAEWGLPSLLKRFSVLGAGLGKGFDSVRAEFDRRLEPEIRKFLAGFSRRGLRGMVDATITRSDLPESVALRKHLAAWLLAQQLGDLMRGADEETIALGQEIGLDVTAAELERAPLKARRRALIEEVILAASDRTVGEALAGLGVTLTPDLDAIAAATWPVVRAAMASPAVQAWLAGMVSEFYDAEAAAG